MRLAIISDIHANLEALTAILQDIDDQNVDQIYCLGDVVGYGADPAACLELVRKRCTDVLMGNHEHAVLGLLSPANLNDIARNSLSWTANQLRDEHKSFITTFKTDLVIDKLHLVHASPWEPTKWHYVLTNKAVVKALETARTNLCLIGHTHLPVIFSQAEDGSVRKRIGHDFLPDPDQKYIVNTGSVGQPRDNDPRACYLIFDSKAYEITYRRVEYDIALAQSKMTKIEAPTLLIERIAVGR